MQSELIKAKSRIKLRIIYGIGFNIRTFCPDPFWKIGLRLATQYSLAYLRNKLKSVIGKRDNAVYFS